VSRSQRGERSSQETNLYLLRNSQSGNPARDLSVKIKKEKLSLCLIKHYAMESYGGSGGIAPPNFTPGEIASGTHWIRGMR
jgi:hypothetical protein